MALRPDKLSFTIFLGALAALPPLSIDMGLPALPQVEAQLWASASEVTQTLSLFLLGFATGPLLLGPLSDRFGRRPILLLGLLIFALGGIGSALSTDIRMLLAFRLVQGIGAGAGGTLPFAIMRDLFDGKQARLRMSAVTLVLGHAAPQARRHPGGGRGGSGLTGKLDGGLPGSARRLLPPRRVVSPT